MSSCKHCGEQIIKTGNYTFRIIPAKRIPKKARKLIRAGKVCEQGSKSYSVDDDATPFQKFLLKRARPANVLEMTCGKCAFVTRIKMEKNVGAKKSGVQASKSAAVVPASKKRKKAKRDRTAGLNVSLVAQQTPQANVSREGKSAAGETKTNQTGSKKAPSAPFQSKKDLDNLKKILFDSKKAKKSGSSLQDFLSSI